MARRREDDSGADGDGRKRVKFPSCRDYGGEISLEFIINSDLYLVTDRGKIELLIEGCLGDLIVSTTWNAFVEVPPSSSTASRE